jgi:hypothetical protein
MNEKVLKIVSLIFFISIVITGCSNSLNNENSTLKKEISESKAVITDLENTVKDLQNKLKEKAKNNMASVPTLENKNNIYPIYTANIDTCEKEVWIYAYSPNNAELEQKLIIIVNALSETYFNNLPIEVVEIEEINNKKIAVINLNESKENEGIKQQIKLTENAWANKYFQGSTGGKVTSVSLIESMLQREHKVQWIDGVRFLYNNGVCNFEHTPELNKVNYRK